MIDPARPSNACLTYLEVRIKNRNKATVEVINKLNRIPPKSWFIFLPFISLYQYFIIFDALYEKIRATPLRIKTIMMRIKAAE